MKLYTYFRSSAAYRVRIALALKGLPYDAVPVHLVKGGGEQRQPGFLALNPAGLVPALDDDGMILAQSMAIIEYLEDMHPAPPLLPSSPSARARVRALAQTIACDIHPLNNLRVLQYLAGTLNVPEERRTAWYRHWVNEGFRTIEELLSQPETGSFCHGDRPGLADCCLVPQVFNARRFGIEVEAFPSIARIDASCRLLPAFQNAHPDRQPDAE